MDFKEKLLAKLRLMRHSYSRYHSSLCDKFRFTPTPLCAQPARGKIPVSLGELYLIVTVLLVLIIPNPVSAQNIDPKLFAAEQGYVGDETIGSEWLTLRIPVNITLKSWRDDFVNRRFGLRLRLAGTFTVKDYPGVIDIGSGQIAELIDQARMVALVPGLEFVIPLGPRYMLRPWFDIGAGRDDQTEAATLLGSLGIRSEFIFDTPSGKWFFGLEPGFQLGADWNRELNDHLLVNPFFTASTRRMLGFDLGGYEPDLGGYFEFGFDVRGIEFANVETSGGSIAKRFEIGLGTGFSRGRPRILSLFYMPRISVGYRFGDITGWRIRIGGDWLTLLSPRHIMK
jgi:hypothetical protein